MSTEDSDLAATYSLIYSFLKERSHLKAAEAVKKVAKDSVIVEGSRDCPTLLVIVRQWRKFQPDGERKVTSVTPTRSRVSVLDTDSCSSDSSESSSEESSSSDSESSSRSPESSTSSKTKRGHHLQANSSAESGKESTSGSDSESGDTRNHRAKKATPGSAPKSVKPVEEKMGSGDSSDSDTESFESSSEDEDDSASKIDVPTPKAVDIGVDGKTTTSIPNSRSSARSSQTVHTIKTSGTTGGDSGSSVGSVSSNGSSPASVRNASSGGIPSSGRHLGMGGGKLREGSTAAAKRRRTDEAGGSVTTSIVQHYDPRQRGNSRSQPRKTNIPFSRIKVDGVRFADERLRDNSFDSRKAAVNDYGAKANADLIVTRGAGFRKEKNKKKKGSYRGGEITMESHSIKFVD